MSNINNIIFQLFEAYQIADAMPAFNTPPAYQPAPLGNTVMPAVANGLRNVGNVTMVAGAPLGTVAGGAAGFGVDLANHFANAIGGIPIQPAIGPFTGAAIGAGVPLAAGGLMHAAANGINRIWPRKK